MNKFLFALLLSLWLGKAESQPATFPLYETATLRVEALTPSVFVHTSYFDSDTFGKVACNGMVYFDQQEAIVFDTPTTDSVSRELIQWIERTLHSQVKAVVATHFHKDCVGGLAEFHRHNVTSYANKPTLKLAKERGFEVPQVGFDSPFPLKIGKKSVISRFFGEGHTADNVVGYLPAENVLFGGCLIKEVGAGKGNLEDASESQWAATVAKIKREYPRLKYVIPGHGKVGGEELLDYTIEKFKVD